MSITPPSTPSKLLTTLEMAAYFAATPRTIVSWREAGRIPFHRLTARCIRYKLEEVEQALGLPIT